jgi:hypothetical protein
MLSNWLVLFLLTLWLNTRKNGLLITALNHNPYDIYDSFTHPNCVIESNNYVLTCLKFDTWPQLITLVNATNAANLTQINEVDIKPSQPIILTGELWQLCKTICLKNPSSQVCSTDNLLAAHISGFKNVDVVTGWETNSDNGKAFARLTLRAVQSTLAFNIDSALNCTEEKFVTAYKNNFTKGTFFNYFQTIAFTLSVVYDSKTNPVCPYLFTNAQLNQITLECLVSLTRFW